MKITTKENAAGRISGYYVDGVKMRKSEIDGIIADRRNEVIYVDDYTGREFKSLTRSPYSNLKVVFTNLCEATVMTEAAAEELGAKILTKWNGSGAFCGLNLCRVETTAIDTNTAKNEAVTEENAETDAANAERGNTFVGNVSAEVMKKYAKCFWRIKHTLAQNGRHMWYASGVLISKKDVVALLAKEGLSVDEYLAAEKQWEKERPVRVAIGLQAAFLEDKINRERKSYDGEDFPAVIPADDADADDDELIDPPADTDAPDNLLLDKIWNAIDLREYLFKEETEELAITMDWIGKLKRRIATTTDKGIREECETELHRQVRIGLRKATRRMRYRKQRDFLLAKIIRIHRSAHRDSLVRAMELALLKFQQFCREYNLTAAQNEMALYHICSQALHELEAA